MERTKTELLHISVAVPSKKLAADEIEAYVSAVADKARSALQKLG